jgi:hypothetical protein
MSNEAAFLNSSKPQDCHLKLPGFGQPLDYAPSEKNIYGIQSRSMFPSALDDRDIEAGYVEYVNRAFTRSTVLSHDIDCLS